MAAGAIVRCVKTDAKCQGLLPAVAGLSQPSASHNANNLSQAKRVKQGVIKGPPPQKASGFVMFYFKQKHTLMKKM
jgi:hypothetical protein